MSGGRGGALEGCSVGELGRGGAGSVEAAMLEKLRGGELISCWREAGVCSCAAV